MDDTVPDPLDDLNDPKVDYREMPGGGPVPKGEFRAGGTPAGGEPRSQAAGRPESRPHTPPIGLSRSSQEALRAQADQAQAFAQTEAVRATRIDAIRKTLQRMGGGFFGRAQTPDAPSNESQATDLRTSTSHIVESQGKPLSVAASEDPPAAAFQGSTEVRRGEEHTPQTPSGESRQEAAPPVAEPPVWQAAGAAELPLGELQQRTLADMVALQPKLQEELRVASEQRNGGVQLKGRIDRLSSAIQSAQGGEWTAAAGFIGEEMTRQLRSGRSPSDPAIVEGQKMLARLDPDVAARLAREIRRQAGLREGGIRTRGQPDTRDPRDSARVLRQQIEEMLPTVTRAGGFFDPIRVEPRHLDPSVENRRPLVEKIKDLSYLDINAAMQYARQAFLENGVRINIPGLTQKTLDELYTHPDVGVPSGTDEDTWAWSVDEHGKIRP